MDDQLMRVYLPNYLSYSTNLSGVSIQVMEIMMNRMRRLGLSLVLGLMMAVLVTSAALAFDCNNPNINDKAVVGTYDVLTDTFTPNKANWGSFDKVNGAWVKLVLPGDISFNIFVKGLLPDGARDSGPGENGCDGKGIDDLDVCLAMFAP